MNYTVNELVQLRADIYDDGEDHHPPGFIAYLDEIVIVRNVYHNSLAVSHPGVKNNAFLVYPKEVRRILHISNESKIT